MKSGQTVFVFGASGGVGSLAVWLASVAGATVVGSAQPDAQEYVRSLGAARTINPNSSQRESLLKRIAPQDSMLLLSPPTVMRFLPSSRT